MCKCLKLHFIGNMFEKYSLQTYFLANIYYIFPNNIISPCKTI